jgi:hypothetical protein
MNRGAKEHVMPLAEVKTGWWIKLSILGRPRWAKLVPHETVLREGDGIKLMVPQLPGDLLCETLVTAAKRRPEGATGMLVARRAGLLP